MEIPFGGKKPQTQKAAFIAPNATICGDVRLEEGVTVWFGAVIRSEFGQTSYIGKDSNIQDNCVLHCDEGYPLEIGAGVTIGHGAIVHGAQVGDNVLIGMHATILNGAKIGAGAVIAAGALVKEHMEIPENALVVGVPGKVVRMHGSDVVAAIQANGQHYVQWGKDYQRLLTENEEPYSR